MNKGRPLLAVCISVAAVSAVALGGKTRSETSVRRAVPASQTLAVEMPEHVPYMFLFHHLVFLKQKADELGQKGRGKSALLKRFQEDAKLTDGQFQALFQVASDCERQVAEQDDKAMAVINAMKASHPDGKLPAGEGPPPLPPELITMQQERDAIVLRARDRLHQTLGEEGFARLNTFVQSRIKPDIKPDIPQ